MKNIIEELWNGEILPQENLTKDNPEYQELRHRQIKKQQELVKTLSDEQNEKFEDYCESALAASAVAEREAFISGFKIAMRDLEIRGAGSLLGNRQHGHMEAVGYDMYLKLLEEAVAMEKGEISEDEPEERECLIDVQIDAHLPEEYIISTSQRLSMYKRIAGIKNEADAQDVYDELTDRFGAPPASVWGLIEIALLRNSAKSLGITDIVQRNGAILFYSSEPDIKTVAILNAFMKGRVTLSAAKRPYIAVKLEPTEATLETIRETLKIMSEAKEHYGKTE